MALFATFIVTVTFGSSLMPVVYFSVDFLWEEADFDSSKSLHSSFLFRAVVGGMMSHEVGRNRHFDAEESRVSCRLFSVGLFRWTQSVSTYHLKTTRVGRCCLRCVLHITITLIRHNVNLVHSWLSSVLQFLIGHTDAVQVGLAVFWTTQIPGGIQFTRHFIQFVPVQTKQFVGGNINVILTRQTCGQH